MVYIRPVPAGFGPLTVYIGPVSAGFGPLTVYIGPVSAGSGPPAPRGGGSRRIPVFDDG